MKQVNIHEAKTHLSQLIAKAVEGKPFIIAKSGTPLVVVKAIRAQPGVRRLGFMLGQISIPSDFDRMGSQEIETLFGSN